MSDTWQGSVTEKDRLRVKRVGRAGDQLIYKGIAALQQTVGAHAVHQNKNNLFSHMINASIC